MSLLSQIFTWWNGQTIGTRFYTARNGELVGEDDQGNRYPIVYEIDEFRCIFCGMCQEVCPVEALVYGRRTDLLRIAHERIGNHPDRYVDHVYGETERGGTSWLRTRFVTLRGESVNELVREKQPAAAAAPSRSTP